MSGEEEPVFLTLPRDLAPGDTLVAEVPAGSWTVRLAGGVFEPTPVEVAPSRLARARVRVAQRSTVLAGPPEASGR